MKERIERGVVKASKEEKIFRKFAFNSRYIIYNKGKEVRKMVCFCEKIEGNMLKTIQDIKVINVAKKIHFSII